MYNRYSHPPRGKRVAPLYTLGCSPCAKPRRLLNAALAIAERRGA